MSKRMIVLDTETTGLAVSKGHRIIEIGCVELVGREIKRTYQQRINPQISIDPYASKVHQIYDEDLQDEPLFNDIAQEFLNFIEDAPLIIHNAPFDTSFINNELRLSKLNVNALTNEIVDTLTMARRNYPGQGNKLDDLCERFNIDASVREDGHGALIDAKLLAQVYLILTGSQVDVFSSPTTKTNDKESEPKKPHQPPQQESASSQPDKKVTSSPSPIKNENSDENDDGLSEGTAEDADTSDEIAKPLIGFSREVVKRTSYIGAGVGAVVGGVFVGLFVAQITGGVVGGFVGLLVVVVAIIEDKSNKKSSDNPPSSS